MLRKSIFFDGLGMVCIIAFSFVSYKINNYLSEKETIMNSFLYFGSLIIVLHSCYCRIDKLLLQSSINLHC